MVGVWRFMGLGFGGAIGLHITVTVTLPVVLFQSREELCDKQHPSLQRFVL